jgi:hypothetical protein
MGVAGGGADDTSNFHLIDPEMMLDNQLEKNNEAITK